MYEWIVFIRPRLIVQPSWTTLAASARQFVVQLALLMTFCVAKLNSLWFTPYTNVASAPSHGADTMTSGAPASRCMAALSREVKMPVLSMTTSTPRSPQGSDLGSRSLSTRSSLPSTETPFLVALIVFGSTPNTESYLSRCAIWSSEPRSLTATTSMSAPRPAMARKKLRPMRPNPLIATRVLAMGPEL